MSGQTEELRDVQDFFSQPQDHRVLNIYVGPAVANQIPMQVPRSLLSTQSQDPSIAINSLDNRVQRYDDSVLRFENDNRTDWEIFIFWLYEKKLPADLDWDIVPAVRAWMFGDKYALHDFQNEVMIKLLNGHASGVYSTISKELLDVLYFVRDSRSMKPREFIVENLVMQQATTNPVPGHVTYDDIADEYDGTLLMVELNAKMKKMIEGQMQLWQDRFKQGWWKTYLMERGQKYEGLQYRK